MKIRLYTLLAFFIAASVFAGNIYYASPTGTADAECSISAPGTIQAAVDKATAGTAWGDADTVILLPGVYDYTDPVWSGKSCVNIPKGKEYLTIRSQDNDPASVIILGRGWKSYVNPDQTTNEPFKAQAFYMKTIAMLEGITITNFWHSMPCVDSSSWPRKLYVKNCVFTGNHSSLAAVGHGTVAIDCAFIANTNTAAYNASGAIYCAVETHVTNCLFANNFGGGELRGISGSLVGSTFFNNYSSTDGVLKPASNLLVDRCNFISNNSGSCAAIHASGSTIISNCNFIGNISRGKYVSHSGKYYNCLFDGNFASAGYAGIANASVVEGCTFINNKSKGPCGALSAMSGIPVVDCVFSNNVSAGHNASIEGSPSMVTNCAFYYNSSAGCGGVAMYGITAYDCIFVGNKSVTYGGVAYSGGKYINCYFEGNNSGEIGAVGKAVITNCTFIGNFATKSAGAGGALANCSVYDSILIGNRAPSYGVISDSKSYLQNCFIVSNETTGARSLYQGYAVNCTFVDNIVGGAAAIDQKAVNCIFAGNKPYDLTSSAVVFSNCMYGTSPAAGAILESCVQTAEPSFNFGANPKLPWYAPGRRSPARDAGIEQPWSIGAVDIAGNPRVKGGAIDIGCYEYNNMNIATKLLVK